jgi:hypothetical protein
LENEIIIKFKNVSTLGGRWKREGNWKTNIQASGAG